jgi:hypothetical protein
MFNSPAGILVLLAIDLLHRGDVPATAEKYLARSGGIILAVAVLFMLAGGK